MTVGEWNQLSSVAGREREWCGHAEFRVVTQSKLEQ